MCLALREQCPRRSRIQLQSEGSMSTDWIDEAAEAIKLRRADKTLQDRKDLSDREIIDNNSRELWREVVEKTKGFIQQLNDRTRTHHLRFKEGANEHEFRIDGEMPEQNYCTVNYTPVNHLLKIDGRHCYLRVIGTHRVVWVDTQDQQAFSSGEIAEYLVKKSLEKAS